MVWEHRLAQVCGLCFLVLGVGCGPRRAPVGAVGANANVEGTVTWEGKPIPVGMIQFVDQNGGPTSFQINNGQYTSKGRPLALESGPKTVRVYGGTLKKGGMRHSGGVVVEHLNNVVAKEYNADSKLSVVIKAGENKLDFALPQ